MSLFSLIRDVIVHFERYFLDRLNRPFRGPFLYSNYVCGTLLNRFTRIKKRHDFMRFIREQGLHTYAISVAPDQPVYAVPQQSLISEIYTYGFTHR